MIKSFEKLKVRIDQNLNRAEKSEALAEDVVKIENKVACLKQVCQSVVKKLSEGVTSSSSSVKGNDGPAVEKRIRKTAEFGLGQTFQENGRAYASHEKPKSTAMSEFLVQGGVLLNDLASNQVQYEIGVEKLVMLPLSAVLEENGPPIIRERKSLSNYLLEYDAVKNKMVRSKDSDLNEEREEKLAADVAEIESKLNNSRENVELLMLQFLAKEGDVGQNMLRYFELKRDYHAQMAERISQHIQHFRTSLSGLSPTFGCDLKLHLDKNLVWTRSRIAFPLRLCVVRLLQLDGLKEEGLFRLAASGLKIKRLAALIDAAECTDEDASHANDITDPHVFAGVLKLYLRELPDPLLCVTKDMYREWLSACSCSTADRKGAIAALLHTLPVENFLNLQYVMAFLNHVSLNNDVNKMTATNLSIVMAPNLIFDNASLAAGDYSDTSVINDIVESFIADFEYYFGDLKDVHLLKDPPCLIGRRNSGFQFKNSTLLQHKNPVNNVINNVDDHRPSTPPNVSSSSAPTRPQAAPPVPAQRTPIPKPRNSRNKVNPPPPRPSDRPSINKVKEQATNTKL